ncbi:MAG: helix-turn-helix domain-containing protein [Candidatus Altiarchaeota archaeon]|nr:helix-turn-helix domain-containing protein [Candidatus Altiarchaeota archaeon]
MDLTTKTQLEKNIAGEITLAAKSSEAMRKWREIFGISQNELARKLGISASVVSDYESGRRKSPGTTFVRKFIEALMEIDEDKGSHVTDKFVVGKPDSGAILDLRELLAPVKASKIVKAVDGVVLANKSQLGKSLMGYTIIDSIQAILKLSERELRNIYGSSTERALIFTKVKLGRSPMIAVKVTQPKPAMIILHGLKPEKVDKLAVKIAEMEGMPLVVSKIKSEEELVKKLRDSI